MPFMHKLSCRLALLKDALIVVSLTALACEMPVRTTGPAGETYLAVVPKTVTVQPSDTVDLMAVGYTSSGDTANIPVRWSMTAGTMVDSTTKGWRHYAKIKAGPQNGTFKVIAHGNQTTATDTAVVTVAQLPVASVLVTPAVVSVLIGAGVQLTATPQDGNGNPLSGRVVNWSTSNAAVATVNSSGFVTGVAAGAANVTATSEGQNGTSAVTVSTVPVASVSVSPPSAALQTGDTVRLTATAKDASGNPLSGRAVSWATSNAAVATVSASGLVTGNAAGSATITATSEGQSGTSAVTVTYVPVASVAVTPASASTQVGQTVQLTATPKDASGNPLSGRSVNWATSNAAVATVSVTGLVTGKAAGSATITATSEGQSGTSAVTVTQVPVASVAVTPASASIQVGQTLQLAATPKDASGNPLSGRTVTWASNNVAVSTVTGSGLVTGTSQGSATITATSEGKNGTAAITVTIPPPPGTHVGWYVAPNGVSSGTGAADRPWDLVTAFAGAGGKIQPGDTVWLRGGTYQGGAFRSKLTGTATAPVVMRQYPGERAIIDGGVSSSSTLIVDGPYSIFWGFEMTNSNPNRISPDGSHDFRPEVVEMHAPNVKFINIVMHDGGIGFYTWPAMPNLEIYGCIIFNQGWAGPDRGHGHAIYAKNNTGPVYIRDNILFNQFGWGVHVYSNAGDGLLNNIHVEGNVSFNSGVLANNSQSGNILIGGQEPADQITLFDNMTYYPAGAGGVNVQIGYESLLNGTMAFSRNYAAGGNPVLDVRYWRGGTVTSNLVHGAGSVVTLTDGNTPAYLWNGNAYYRNATAAAWKWTGTSYTLSNWQAQTGLGATDQAPAATPSGTQVFVRPNVYEPGRANIIVYNWSGQAGVSVNLSGVVPIGDRYEVRNVQDLFGAPVASGTFGGGSISLPMVAVQPPTPFGNGWVPAPVTGPTFNVFVVTSAK